jgi:hypothetical protein
LKFYDLPEPLPPVFGYTLRPIASADLVQVTDGPSQLVAGIISVKTISVFLLALFIFGLSEAEAQQCRVTGPTCSDAKAQCRQLRKRAFPGKTNNPCANRFRRCMAEGKYVSRNCNVSMEKR